MDGEYSIVITATGEGAISYSIEEYSTLNGESLRSVAYLDIPLYERKIFNATVPEAMNASQDDALVVYPLVTDSDELIPNIDVTGEEVDSAKCEIEVQLDGEMGGIITGSGEYLIGARANLVANPFECYTFDGWYLGEEKLSDEIQYSFVVKENISIITKFVDNHTTDGEWIIDVNETCTENGSKHQICSICSETIQTERILIEGHVNGNWTIDKEAEIGVAGEKHISCIKCGEVIEMAIIDPLPRDTDDDEGQKDSVFGRNGFSCKSSLSGLVGLVSTFICGGALWLTKKRKNEE